MGRSSGGGIPGCGRYNGWEGLLLPGPACQHLFGYPAQPVRLHAEYEPKRDCQCQNNPQCK